MGIENDTTDDQVSAAAAESTAQEIEEIEEIEENGEDATTTTTTTTTITPVVSPSLSSSLLPQQPPEPPEPQPLQSSPSGESHSPSRSPSHLQPSQQPHYTSISECLYGVPEEHDALWEEFLQQSRDNDDEDDDDDENDKDNDNEPDDNQEKHSQKEDDPNNNNNNNNNKKLRRSIRHFEQVLWKRQARVRHYVVPLGPLRRLAALGIPDEGSHRAVVWRVLLGYLPSTIDDWPAHVVHQRQIYYQKCRRWFGGNNNNNNNNNDNNNDNSCWNDWDYGRNLRWQRKSSSTTTTTTTMSQSQLLSEDSQRGDDQHDHHDSHPRSSSGNMVQLQINTDDDYQSFSVSATNLLKYTDQNNDNKDDNNNDKDDQNKDARSLPRTETTTIRSEATTSSSQRCRRRHPGPRSTRPAPTRLWNNPNVLQHIPLELQTAWTERGKDLPILQSLMKSFNALRMPTITTTTTQRKRPTTTTTTTSTTTTTTTTTTDTTNPHEDSLEEQLNSSSNDDDHDDDDDDKNNDDHNHNHDTMMTIDDFCNSLALLDEIHKDVVRTHADLSFFLDPHDDLGRRRYAAIERILFIWAKTEEEEEEEEAKKEAAETEEAAANRNAENEHAPDSVSQISSSPPPPPPPPPQRRTTRIRYVQGMNEIVGALYYVLANDERTEWANGAEADTYWLFTALLQPQEGLRDMFCPELDTPVAAADATGSAAGNNNNNNNNNNNINNNSNNTSLRGQLSALQDLLALHDPALFEHLMELGLAEASFYAVRWFTTLLSREFLLPDTIRLWDSMLASTHKANFLRYVCVTLLLNVRQLLLHKAATDFAAAISLLHNYPPLQHYPYYNPNAPTSSSGSGGHTSSKLSSSAAAAASSFTASTCFCGSMDHLLECSRSLYWYETQITVACHRAQISGHEALTALPPPPKIRASLIMAFGWPHGVAPHHPLPYTHSERVQQATAAVANQARHFYQRVFFTTSSSSSSSTRTKTNQSRRAQSRRNSGNNHQSPEEATSPQAETNAAVLPQKDQQDDDIKQEEEEASSLDDIYMQAILSTSESEDNNNNNNNHDVVDNNNDRNNGKNDDDTMDGLHGWYCEQRPSDHP
ncbi:hypothetical protein ACA910_000140 [Epithemia clementina (nom. ined.)]